MLSNKHYYVGKARFEHMIVAYCVNICQNKLGMKHNYFVKKLFSPKFFIFKFYKVLPRLQKKKPVDFDDELRIGDVRYDNII